jgi:RND family efflux transporter MFP subunit
VQAGCSDIKTGTVDSEGVATVLPDETNHVTVSVLKRQPFSHELVSNGKITATQVADLRFTTSEPVVHIYAQNGDRVCKGDKLAELDKFKLHNSTENARDALERAKLEMQDVLIGQGYAAADTANIPVEMLKLARVKSGYDQSRVQYDLARYEEEHATLTAPFDGIVANLNTKPYNLPNTSEPFCTIIGTQGMEADFTVLENELTLIRVGDKVVVTPYAETNAKYDGRVSQINPYVDDKGMVRVKATVSTTAQARLFYGMNVRVHVYRVLADELVIPKSAVVMRSGKQVVFTLKNGKAVWNYVTIGLENGDQCTVNERGDGGAEGLNPGDAVIVTGNVNLAHDAPVTLMDR